MYFLTHLFQICYFSIFVKLLSGYLIFAANFEDFHTIAKKLGAKNFPDGLIRNPSPKNSYEDDDYEKSYEIQQKSHQAIKKHSNSKISDTKIDFEELVERVKKRIEKELKEKYLNNVKLNKKGIHDEKQNEKNNVNSEQKSNKNNNKSKLLNKNENIEEMSPFEYDTEYVDDITDKPKKSSTNKTRFQEERLEYADATIEMTPSNKKHNKKNNKEPDSSETVTYNYNTQTETNNMPFKTIHMSKKDTYEDYKMPEKETNIYSSTEEDDKRFKVEKNNEKKPINKEDTESKTYHINMNTKGFKSHSKKSRMKKTTRNYDYTDKLIDTEEIKAKTEYSQDFDETVSRENTKKVKSGTNIPTRERYKIVTPNYNAKLPSIVEKYDFEEPIPDKDRERENLKYYGNPPARINKKIRLM